MNSRLTSPDPVEAVMAIAAKPAPTAISTRLDVQRQLSCIKTLAGLAEARQAGVSKETLNLYSRELCEFDPADVREVVRTLAIRKRVEGETAFPALGDLLEPLKDRRTGASGKSAKSLNSKNVSNCFGTTSCHTA